MSPKKRKQVLAAIIVVLAAAICLNYIAGARFFPHASVRAAPTATPTKTALVPTNPPVDVTSTPTPTPTSEMEVVDMGQLGSNTYVYSLALHDGRLYGGTQASGRVYRYDGKGHWSDVGRLGANSAVLSLAVYGGALYGGTYDSAGAYRYDGDNNWTNVGYLGADEEGNTHVLSLLAVHDGGGLYGGTYGSGKVYRYAGGGDKNWTDVGRPGNNTEAGSLAIYNGRLYAGTGSGEVYAYYGNITWGLVGMLGAKITAMTVFDDGLYAGTLSGNVYRYFDGIWTEAGKAVSGSGIYSLAVYGNRLYAGGASPAKTYRYDNNTWLDVTGKIDDYSDVRSLAVYEGRLYAGMAGNGKVYSIGNR